MGGADHNYFIIWNPLYLVDSARAWLENLRPECIQNWADLEEIFVRNFQGTYMCPDNSWDLKNCM